MNDKDWKFYVTTGGCSFSPGSVPHALIPGTSYVTSDV